MKEILIRLLVAAFLTFAAFALSSSARGQQPDSTPNSVVPKQQQQVPSTQSPRSPDAELSDVTDAILPGDDQTQDAFVFTGHITRENGSLVLMDPVTRIHYQLDNQSRAMPFLGHQVRVVGKLEMRSNTILIDTIGTRP